ncbi:hypothetical protein BC830DRAFT_1234757 [Chytriomyces sp. MP71]|nr:hypothetical protein BC830DRAFT_1234757 [Chytriomyces sp. MP71]
MNFHNSASLLNQEMNFVLERVAKRLISSTMDVTLPVSCSNCTYASTSYVEKVPFWSIVGTMNALSLLFGVGSLLIVAFGHIGDNDVNAALTIFTFGGDIGPENEFKKPIVAPAVSNNIRTGARNNRHYEMMERTSMGDKNTSDFGTFQ